MALLVATSGSTGTPKAVELGRAAVLASVAATHERLGGPGHWHLALPAHHVAGAMVVARSIVAETPLVPASSRLTDLAPRPGRNYLSVVPTQLARAADDPQIVAALARFDAVLLGGAAAPPSLTARLRAAGVRLVTTYGMSETCGGCVYDGRPLRGVEVVIGDDERVALRTPTAFTGYRGRPDLTAAVTRDGLVLTGDRGRLEGGRLVVTGRLDDVIISGGVNVDLAAVERRLRERLGTDELVAVGVDDPIWGQRVAIVAGVAVDADRLARASAALEPAARPRRVLGPIRLPLLSTGKIDRSACRRLAEEPR